MDLSSLQRYCMKFVCSRGKKDQSRVHKIPCFVPPCTGLTCPDRAMRDEPLPGWGVAHDGPERLREDVVGPPDGRQDTPRPLRFRTVSPLRPNPPGNEPKESERHIHPEGPRRCLGVRHARGHHVVAGNNQGQEGRVTRTKEHSGNEENGTEKKEVSRPSPHGTGEQLHRAPEKIPDWVA